MQGNGGTLNLKGRATLQSIDEDGINAVFAVFGPDAFKASSAFRIVADGIFLAGPEEVLSGHSATYSLITSGIEGTIRYQITNDPIPSGVSLNRTTGVLTTTENTSSDVSITIRGSLVSGSEYYQKSVTVIVRKVVYPANVTISGDSQIIDATTYHWAAGNQGSITGEYAVEWSLSGDILSYATGAASADNSSYTITPIEGERTAFAEGTLSLTVKKASNDSVITTATKTVVIQDDNVAFTSVTNPGLMSVMYANGLCDNPNYMTTVQCADVLTSDLTSSGNSIFTRNSSFQTSHEDMSVFKYFTGITSLPNGCFDNCYFTTIILPQSLTSIGYRGLYVHDGLSSIQHVGGGAITIGDLGIRLKPISGTPMHLEFPIVLAAASVGNNYPYGKIEMNGSGEVFFDGTISGLAGSLIGIDGKTYSLTLHISSLSNIQRTTGSNASADKVTLKISSTSVAYINSITTCQYLFYDGHIYLGENIHSIGERWIYGGSGTITCEGSISSIADNNMGSWRLELLNNDTVPSTIDLYNSSYLANTIVKHSLLDTYRNSYKKFYEKFDDGFVAQGSALDWRAVGDNCRRNDTTTKVHVEKQYNGTYADGTSGQEWLEDSIAVSTAFPINDTGADITRTLSYTLSGVSKNYSFTHSKEAFLGVDLGLPSGLKWADVNVGASFVDEEGLYFAWGETTGYANAAARNTALGRSDGFSKAAYVATGANEISANLSSSNDAAYVATNGEWRMPTRQEFTELINNTDGVSLGTVSGGHIELRKRMKKTDHSVYVILAYVHYILDNEQTTYAYGKRLWTSSFVQTSVDTDVNAYIPSAWSASADNSVNYDYQYQDKGYYGMNIRAVQ